MLKLHNTLTKKVEGFIPLNPPKVGLYTCGPTVYDYTHIGHLRTYVGNDILKRILGANGYEVLHVMNITDVGHLTSDADEGDDKLDKRAKERGQTVWEVAKFFEEYFFKSTDQVNVLRPDIVARATEHINEQIKLIEKLVENGFTYKTDEAIYFDTSKLSDYGKLTGQKLDEKQVGARVEVVVDPKKKNPADFALWFFTIGRFSDHTMRWPSPWGEGFPGWHIECSAMSMEYLGNTLDIHTGGIDHIPVHHTNEIAQSEAATGEQFSKVWIHHGWVLVDGEKMSKSKENFYTVDDIKERGTDPLALRYLFLTAHYKDPLNFTSKSLEAAQNALNNLRSEIRDWSVSEYVKNGLSEQSKKNVGQYWQRFLEAANNDLNMPQAIAVLWEMVKSNDPLDSKAVQLLEMDKILGLKLDEYLGKPLEVPDKVMKLVQEREKARSEKDFEKSDQLRKKIKELGFEVEDTPQGPQVK